MMKYSLRPTGRWLTQPAASLVVSLLAALLLFGLPWTTEPLRKAMAGLLRPGQALSADCRRAVREHTNRLVNLSDASAQLSAATAELEHLRHENQQLHTLLTALRTQPARQTLDRPHRRESDPLLVGRLVEARLLGRQARAYLGERRIIDVGASSGVIEQALVFEAPPLLDAGGDLNVCKGNLVIAGRRILGRISEVGPYTSTFQCVDQHDYRDRVRVIPADRQSGQTAAEGLLQGAGDGLCRIRLVDNTVPISEGDLVLAAAEEGIVSEPLLYGTVISAEAPAGAGYWEISMEAVPPVAAGGAVAVFCTSLNPARLAGGIR